MACQIIKLFDNAEMCYCSPDGQIAQTLKEKEIRFIPLEKLSFKNVKKAVEEFKPDVIHAHDYKASVIASMFSHIKIISHIHGNKDYMNKLSLHSLAFLYASKKIDKIIFVSKSCYDNFYFKKKIENKYLILPNIIDECAVKQKCDEDKKEYNFDIVFLGRLVEEKNPLRLINIAKILKEKNIKYKFAIVGDGILKEQIIQKINEYKLNNEVKLLGYFQNPYKILSQSKLLLMTSIREGLPMCALEAMALGVPVISTKTDGMVELVKNDINGFLFETDEEAAVIIQGLLQDKGKQTKLKALTQNFSKEYNNLNEYKKTLLKLYENKI